MLLTRTATALLAALVLGLAAAGCGGGDKTYSGTKPDEWTATVCGAVNEWVRGIQSGSARMQDDLRNETDVKAVKARFVVFLKEAESGAGKMVTKVKAAGAPAIKDGAALQRDLESALGEAKSSLTNAVANAEQLPTNDLESFSNGVTSVGNQVQRELATTGQDFDNLSDKYDDEALDEATSKEPACKKLNDSPS